LGAVSYRRTYPRLTFTIESGFSEDGAWAIGVRVEFQDGKAPPIGSHAFGSGLAALLIAIEDEGRRGRRFGAKRVKVTMDAGDGPVDLPPELVIPEGGDTF